eukprot:GHUV01051927.1.p1 GENE.GHUV01051927.1~~GHUV01051927.1.p1  ORF type:complete len:106 (-),score=15.44 GHUV01051927.1:174-491(-)
MAAKAMAVWYGLLLYHQAIKTFCILMTATATKIAAPLPQALRGQRAVAPQPPALGSTRHHTPSLYPNVIPGLSFGGSVVLLVSRVKSYRCHRDTSTVLASFMANL